MIEQAKHTLRKKHVTFVSAVGLIVFIFVLWFSIPKRTQTHCEPGQYFLFTNGICLDCPAGTFAASGDSRNMSCEGPCQAGFWCPSGSVVDNFEICQEGFYCPRGTGGPKEYPCPVGTFGAEKGLTNEECSGRCIAILGKYCAPGSTSDDEASQLQCPVGYFCDGILSEPQPCTNGTWGGEEGLSSEFCSGVCPLGYFCPEASTRPNKNICPKGHFCPEGSMHPLPCPNGTFSDHEGLSTEKECMTCPKGRWCSEGSSHADTLCPAGFFCLEGTTNPWENPCSPGYFCPHGSSEPNARVCVAGGYCPGQTGPIPLPCPAGYYSNLTGAQDESACLLKCPEKYFCPPGTGADWVTLFPCPPGYYCPTGTPGEANYVYDEETDGIKLASASPTEAFKCPGGYRNRRTHLSALTGCFCNYTGGDSDCPCPAGFYCPAGSTFEDTTPCPFNYYCPEKSTEPTPCAAVGYFCPRFSSRETFRTVRAELSLFGLQNSLSSIQNTDPANKLTNLAEKELEGPRREQFAGSLDLATKYLVSLGLPIFELRRGRSEIRADIISRGLTAAGISTSVGRQVWVCKVNNPATPEESVEKVFLVEELPAGGLKDDPEQSFNVSFTPPRYTEPWPTYAFCIQFNSSRSERLELSQRFSISNSNEADSERAMSKRIVWLVFLPWAILHGLIALHKRSLRRLATKRLRFERFVYFETKFAGCTEHAFPKLHQFHRVLGVGSIAVEGYFFSMLSFSIASPKTCFPFLHQGVEISLSAVYCRFVMGLVLVFSVIPQVWDLISYWDDRGRLPTKVLNENKSVLAMFRHFILAPLLYEAMYPHVLAVLLYPIAGCAYTNRTSLELIEFVEDVYWTGNEPISCWHDMSHTVHVAVGALLVPFFFRGTTMYLLDFKPDLNCYSPPVVALFDYFLLLTKTWMVVFRALCTFSDVPAMSCTLNIINLGLLFILNGFVQPVFGTPYAHRANDIRSANLVLGMLVAVLSLSTTIRGMQQEEDGTGEQCWFLFATIFLGPLLWYGAAILNSKRSTWELKKMKNMYLRWLENPETSLDTLLESIPRLVDCYGPTSSFALRILHTLSHLAQRSQGGKESNSVANLQVGEETRKILHVALILEAKGFASLNQQVSSKHKSAPVLYWDRMIARLPVVGYHVSRIAPAPLVSDIHHGCSPRPKQLFFMHGLLGSLQQVNFRNENLPRDQCERLVKCLPILRSIRELTLSGNDLSNQILEELLQVLHKNITIKRVEIACEAVHPFKLPSSAFASLFSQNMVLEDLFLGRLLAFHRPIPELMFHEVLERRKHAKEVGELAGVRLNLFVQIHRFHSERNSKEANWMMKMLLAVLRANSSGCWGLDVSIGGGTSYGEVMKNELAILMDHVSPEERFRIRALRTMFWEQDFQAAELMLTATDTAPLLQEDHMIHIALVRSMPLLRVIKISRRALRFVTSGGAAEFIPHMARVIEERVGSRWEEDSLIIKLDNRTLVPAVGVGGWGVIERKMPSLHALIQNCVNEERPERKDSEVDMLSGQGQTEARIEKNMDKFSFAVPRYCQENMEPYSLSFADCGMTDADAVIMSLGLKHNGHLKEVFLEGNYIGDDGASTVAKALVESNKISWNLREVSFGNWKSGNCIGPRGADKIAEHLFGNAPCIRFCKECGVCRKAAPRLVHLDLRNNRLGSFGCEKLLAGRRVLYLRTLHLCSNAIGDAGAATCAAFLETNQTVHILRLSRNEISAKGAIPLALALERNVSLQELFLDWNELMDEGLAHLSACLKKSSLRVLSVEHNLIGDSGLASLTEQPGLEDSELRELFLGYNPLSDMGIIPLAELFSSGKSPRHLQTLSLSGTEISDYGAGKLVEGILKNAPPELACVDASNCPHLFKPGMLALLRLQRELNARHAGQPSDSDGTTGKTEENTRRAQHAQRTSSMIVQLERNR